MSWLLNCIYIGVLLAASPVLLWKRFRHGKYRHGWTEKLFGLVPRRESNAPCIWFHAVSVGEVLQLEPIVAQLKEARPDCEVAISTTTSTGYAVAREKFPSAVVCYFPLDFSWAVRTAVRRIRPTAVVLVELELWPNFIRSVHLQGVPLAIINGRMSQRSYNGYRRIRPVVAAALRRVRLIAVQNEIYAERFADLTGRRDNLHVTGSIKLDRLQTDRGNLATESLRRDLGLQPGEVIFIAGSTQSPEEQFAIETYKAVRLSHRSLRLIVVPRHQERFDEVARLIERTGLSLQRRSQSPPEAPTNEPTVILLDTLGELAACWGLADIAFVGGSLTPRGGQNMLEPAAYGAAVLFGPHTANFREPVEQLLAESAAEVVTGQYDLTRAVRQFLDAPKSARDMGQRARQWVLSQTGGTHRTVELLCRLLPERPREVAAETYQVRAA